MQIPTVSALKFTGPRNLHFILLSLPKSPPPSPSEILKIKNFCKDQQFLKSAVCGAQTRWAEAFNPSVAPERTVGLGRGGGGTSLRQAACITDPSPMSLFFSYDSCLMMVIANPLSQALCPRLVISEEVLPTCLTGKGGVRAAVEARGGTP